MPGPAHQHRLSGSPTDGRTSLQLRECDGCNAARRTSEKSVRRGVVDRAREPSEWLGDGGGHPTPIASLGIRKASTTSSASCPPSTSGEFHVLSPSVRHLHLDAEWPRQCALCLRQSSCRMQQLCGADEQPTQPLGRPRVPYGTGDVRRCDLLGCDSAPARVLPRSDPECDPGVASQCRFQRASSDPS
jgi:hypothetical protein